MPSIQSKVSQIIGARALASADMIENYSRDESDYGAYPPDTIALVENGDEIAEIMKLAEQDRIFVTPRGLGSGRTGGALAYRGGIVISTERMNRIHHVDIDNLVAVVEPGVITGDLQDYVETLGLFYPPDPASLAYCSLGGNVAENAGGARAVKYGVTRDYVLGLNVTLMGGTRMSVGGRTVKGVTGFDLVSLLTGSEGTLAIIDQMTLRLLPNPQKTATFLACFADVITAGRAVSTMTAAGYQPRSLELIDQYTVSCLRRKGHWPIPQGEYSLLLVELDGTEDEVDRRMMYAAHQCERSGAQDVLIATDETKRREIWAMRRVASTTLKELHHKKVGEDVVVPRAKIPPLLDGLDSIAATHGIKIACFGHAGDGNVHVNLLFDSDEQLTQCDTLRQQIFRLAIELGGRLSGEHGIGLSKKKYMPIEQSTATLALQRKVKQAFDPLGLLNPGKIFPD